MARARAAKKAGWLRADRDLLIHLLGSMTGGDALVAAWLLDNMDSRTNRVWTTQGSLVEADQWLSSHGRRARGGRRKDPAAPTVALSFRRLQEVGHGSCLDVPFLARDREVPGAYMVNPLYLCSGYKAHRNELQAEFDALVGREVRKASRWLGADGKGGRRPKFPSEVWLKLDHVLLVDLLASLRGSEPKVIAALVEAMDADNVVHMTQAQMIRGMAGGAAVGQAGLTEALRYLGGGPSRGRDGLVPAFCVREGYGRYLVNPAYVFKGSDERGDALRREFRQVLVRRERERRSRQDPTPEAGRRSGPSTS